VVADIYLRAVVFVVVVRRRHGHHLMFARKLRSVTERPCRPPHWPVAMPPRTLVVVGGSPSCCSWRNAPSPSRGRPDELGRLARARTSTARRSLAHAKAARDSGERDSPAPSSSSAAASARRCRLPRLLDAPSGRGEKGEGVE
jgi:hypothetical protein